MDQPTSYYAVVEALHERLKGRVFFLEIGAMDGVAHDPLHIHIVKHPQWRGLLVEPLPDMFARLKETYRGHSNLAFENAAITERDGTAEIKRIPADRVGTAAPDWADGISTLRPDIHIIGRYDELKSQAVTETIKTMTFATLIKKHHVTGVDILQIDTEGYDQEIFEQVWQTGFRPGVIKLEINYLTRVAARDLENFLTTNQYRTFIEGDDLVATAV